MFMIWVQPLALFCLQHWSKFNEARKQSHQSHICYSHSSAKMARSGAPKSHHWAGQSCVSASRVAGSVFPEHHDSRGSNSWGGPSDGDSPSGDFLIISNDPMSKKHFYHTEVSYLMYFYQNHKIFYLLPFLWRPQSHLQLGGVHQDGVTIARSVLIMWLWFLGFIWQMNKTLKSIRSMKFKVGDKITPEQS